MKTKQETEEQFEREQEAYWRHRDELLKQHTGKWVAIVGGRVVAVAGQMNDAAAQAYRATGSTVMYVSLVGQEDIVLRIRGPRRGDARLRERNPACR